MKHTPFARKPSSKGLTRRPMRRGVGGKTAHWSQIRAELKLEFERSGVTRCEVCNAGYPLSFAHRMKRRFITDDDELRMVALLCIPCHEKIEFSGHGAMFDKITALIEGRE